METDASPFYLHSSVPLVGTSFTITNPAHLHGFGGTNSTEYFGFPNPYYVGTRSGRTINFGSDATFDETNAFIDGLVPYGDIP